MANADQQVPPIVRVLQVEDSALDAELVLTELDRDGLRYEVLLVDDEVRFLDALATFGPHIVLSDLSMPGFSGRHALALLRARDEELPFIFVSATLGEEAAIAALRDGATDYILKQNPARLASAVRRALREASARRERRRDAATRCSQSTCDSRPPGGVRDRRRGCPPPASARPAAGRRE